MNILRLKKAVFLSIILAMGFIRTAFAQNFDFTIQPDSLTLVPGQSASFVVSLTPLDGFTNPVTLSVTNLGAGVTATFSPQTVTTLPGTSLLTLEATTNATTNTFTLELIAVGGGITNKATGSVSVSFGLLPICYGAFQGVVTDATTGKPIAGATVQASYYYVTTDSNGFYTITNLTLAGSENQPEEYSITASSNGYYSANALSYAVCDATNTVNIQLVREETTTISGSITAEGGGPLAGVTIGATYQYNNTAVSDSNGMFQITNLSVGNDNSAANYLVQVAPTGYWYISTNVITQANSNTVLNLVATPVCYQTVTGSVVYSNGMVASNVSVSISSVQPSDGYGEDLSATTDANGDYIFTNVTLSLDNTPRAAYATASQTGYYGASTNMTLNTCSPTPIAFGIMTLDPIPPPPTVTNNYGSLDGHVYDIQTGLIITNASVYIYDVYYTDTDAKGFYVMSNLYVGSDATTNTSYYVQAAANNYFTTASNVVVDANQTNTLDLYLLPVNYGAVEGVAYNSTTGLPVSNVNVTVGSVSKVTDADGQYFTGPLPLNTGNTPAYEYITAQAPGYWTYNTNTTITNNITNIVNLEMIQVCGGATIIGNVVNALTQAPITNATVSAYSAGYELYGMTDTNGNFIITNLTVGNNNSPIQTTLTASAPGFNSQSKTVTIFCDATISTTFGAPETTFGTVQGYVTNVLSGLPLTNAFIGSSFGGATTTDTNGYYILHQVPLGAGGSNRTWTVTAIPNGFPSQTKSFVASANVTNEVDFGFGQPLTELVVSATGTPNPVDVGSNLTYSIILTNYMADATNVVLTDTLPPGVTFVGASVTNNPGGFGIPVQSNGIVTVSGSNLGSNAGVVLLITVTPTVAGVLTNVVTVTSDTPDVSPNSTNHTAIVLDTAQEVETLFADVGITMTGAPNPVLVSNQLTYQLIVNNTFGPDTATSVIVTDTLPANVTFGSASVSQGSFSHVANTVLWNVGSLAVGASASATIVILPLQVGQVENIATVGLGPTIPLVTDNDPDNNEADVFTTVTTPTITTGSLQYGAITFNSQTGLFEQTVTYFNQPGEDERKLGAPIPPAANAVRVFVLDLPSGVQLYNATGTSNGAPYVEYDNTVPSGGSVQFGLEYYEGSRLPFTSTNFMAVAVVAVTVPLTSGTYLQLDRASFLYDGELTIEFATVPGHTYEIQYSSDMQTWAAAVPQIVAVNTRTEWTDVGPPVTASYGSLGDRFYRIVEIK